MQTGSSKNNCKMLIYKLVCVYFISVGQDVSCRRVNKNDGLKSKRISVQQIRRADQICYDIVGCFDLPRKFSPLHKGPESPAVINTKFFLFRNDLKFSTPQRLYYEDNGRTLNQSKFNASEHVKVIVHGYLGSWRDGGGLAGAKLYTQLCKCNVILLDWERGARGPNYGNAAANTEIVGRQLGILLLHMINQGLDPHYIHIVGFSLGAHVAGCASEVLKSNGLMIGRITGLDAASPLFRNNHVRAKSKKLDRSDALLVDAVHTDSSPFFTDGFGLLEPIGHVDFFPNGGFEQPGCSDRTASVVVTHLEKTLTRETACSHVRAWELFRESLEIQLKQAPSCSFVAYKCRGGLEEYRQGECFPSMDNGGFGSNNDIGKMGEYVQGDGIMYLATKNKYPFCGTQMQVGIFLTNATQSLNGMVHCNLRQGNSSINFKIPIFVGETGLAHSMDYP
ncbi:pancreatic lipase-related protein 2-like isoform X2 [Photinus pyralis]|uniref:pancreatic lipase-related protein 2-like isoform X2 n=1 Tax=Photinus pyralis TaxID=7054 RepID=UPI0012672020|nr:pancreatic lipase-related protein 2-like isoform X2 [Photinus pyralis]